TRREAEQRRTRRMDLRVQADPAEYNRRSAVVESLRGLIPRMDAARRIYAASIDRLNATSQENTAHQSAVTRVRPPSPVAVFLFIGLIWSGAAGIEMAGHLYTALILIAVSLTPLLWYRKRVSASAILQI